MLKQIRKNARGFLYILIISFIAWLAFDAINSGQRLSYAGKIFGKTISINEYQKAYLAARTKAIFTYGDRLREFENEINLDEEAWGRLILLHEAKKEKLSAADKEVLDTIKAIPVFADRNGKFSIKLYEDILRYSFKITPKAFEDMIREDLAIEKLVKGQNDKITVSDDEALKEYKTVNEKVKASYILFKTGDYLAQAKYTEEEIKSYFEKNKDAFKIPEQVNVEYFGKAFSSSAGDEEKDKIRKEMRDISYEFAGSKDFTGVAKQFSLEVKETGFFSGETKIPNIGWDIKFSDFAFSLKPGEISNPVETKTGIYILRTKERRSPRPAALSEVNDKVAGALKAEKAQNDAKAKAEEALSAIKTRLEKKEKFEDIAKSLSLTVKEDEPFTRNSYIEGLAIAPEFINAAFSLKEGEVFGQTVRTHDGYAIVKQVGFISIDENKYKEEKDKFKEQLLAQKKYINSITWFLELKKRADLRSNLDKIRSGN